MRSLIKLFTRGHWSHSQSHAIMDFETCGSGSIAIDSPLLLFTQQYKTTRFNRHQQSLSQMSEVNSYMRKNALNNYRNSKWTFDDSLPSYCYATKGHSRTMLSQVSQRESAGEVVAMVELQTHHCISPEQWSWLLCSVSATPVNKVLLHELNWSESRCWLQIF